MSSWSGRRGRRQDRGSVSAGRPAFLQTESTPSSLCRRQYTAGHSPTCHPAGQSPSRRLYRSHSRCRQRNTAHLPASGLRLHFPHLPKRRTNLPPRSVCLYCRGASRSARLVQRRAGNRLPPRPADTSIHTGMSSRRHAPPTPNLRKSSASTRLDSSRIPRRA